MILYLIFRLTSIPIMSGALSVSYLALYRLDSSRFYSIICSTLIIFLSKWGINSRQQFSILNRQICAIVCYLCIRNGSVMRY